MSRVYRTGLAGCVVLSLCACPNAPGDDDAGPDARDDAGQEATGDGGAADAGLADAGGGGDGGGDGGGPDGTLGNACYGNGTCNEGLTCHDEVCVDPVAALPRGAALWAEQIEDDDTDLDQLYLGPIGRAASGALQLVVRGDDARFNRGTPSEFLLGINHYTQFIYAELVSDLSTGEAEVPWASPVGQQSSGEPWLIAPRAPGGVYLLGDTFYVGAPDDAVIGLHSLGRDGALLDQTWLEGTSYRKQAVAATPEGSVGTLWRSAPTGSLTVPAGSAAGTFDDELIIVFGDEAAAVTDLVRVNQGDTTFSSYTALASDGGSGFYLYLRTATGTLSVAGAAGTTTLTAPGEIASADGRTHLLARVDRDGTVLWERWYRGPTVQDLVSSPGGTSVAIELFVGEESGDVVFADGSGASTTVHVDHHAVLVFDREGDFTQVTPHVYPDCTAVADDGAVAVLAQGPTTLPSGESVPDKRYLALFEGGQDVWARVLDDGILVPESGCLLEQHSATVAFTSLNNWTLPSLAGEAEHTFIGRVGVVLGVKR